MKGCVFLNKKEMNQNNKNHPKQNRFSRFIVDENENNNTDIFQEPEKNDNKAENIIPDNKKISRSKKRNKKAERPVTKAEIARNKRLKARSTYTLALSVKCVAYAALVALIYIGSMKAYSFGSAIFDEKGVEEEGKDVVVTIPAGASVSEVAVILKENGLIKDEKIFNIQARLFEGKFYSGTFNLKTSYGAEKIIDILSVAPETKSVSE